METKAKRLGLTLTEMLLALAITGLLLAAALRVTTTASRCATVNDDTGQEALSRTHLKRLLTMDILHADKYRQTKDGVEMQLHACLDKDSLAIKHKPSTVAYETRRIGEKFWLVRTQRQGSDVWSELVTPDVRIIIPDIPDIPEQLLKPGAWGEISESFALNIIFAETNKSPMRVNCILK